DKTRKRGLVLLRRQAKILPPRVRFAEMSPKTPFHESFQVIQRSDQVRIRGFQGGHAPYYFHISIVVFKVIPDTLVRSDTQLLDPPGPGKLQHDLAVADFNNFNVYPDPERPGHMLGRHEHGKFQPGISWRIQMQWTVHFQYLEYQRRYIRGIVLGDIVFAGGCAAGLCLRPLPAPASGRRRSCSSGSARSSRTRVPTRSAVARGGTAGGPFRSAGIGRPPASATVDQAENRAVGQIGNGVIHNLSDFFKQAPQRDTAAEQDRDIQLTKIPTHQTDVSPNLCPFGKPGGRAHAQSELYT